MSDVSDLLGKTLVRVEQIRDEIIEFEELNGTVWRLYHSRDCCEGVTIEDVAGDLADLVGTPLCLAECNEQVRPTDGMFDTETWTFYRFTTIKGSVVVRWVSTSNGWYSETVDFERWRP